MAGIPISLPQRTQSNTRAEHLADHNAIHLALGEYIKQIPVNYTWSTGSNTITNIPAAVTEVQISGTTDARRMIVDLTNARKFSFVVAVGVVGNAGSKIAPQFSINGGTNWFYLSSGVASGSAPTAPDFLSLAALGIITGGFQTLVTTARVTSVLLRLVTLDGDGAADPVTGLIHMLFGNDA